MSLLSRASSSEKPQPQNPKKSLSKLGFNKLGLGDNSGVTEKSGLKSSDKQSSPTTAATTTVKKEKSISKLQAQVSQPISSVLKIIPHQPPIVVSQNDSINSVLKVLHDRGSRNAVVQRVHHTWYPPCGKNGVWCFSKKKHYSFFDVRDLCYHVMRLYQLWPNKSVQDIITMIKKEKVWKVANISNRVPFVPIDVTESVSGVAAAFGVCCRVPLFEKGTLVRILTPADFLTILRHLNLVAAIEAEENISIKALAKREVMTIRESESLLKAMTLMERHGYSAIPIVAEHNFNSVLEVITVKDIKYLCTAQDKLGSKDILNTPALIYVQFIRNPGGIPSATTPVAPVVNSGWSFISDESSLDEIFEVFLNFQIHRIILKGHNGNMTGMLTLTDVMSRLSEVLGKYKHH